MSRPSIGDDDLRVVRGAFAVVERPCPRQLLEGSVSRDAHAGPAAGMALAAELRRDVGERLWNVLRRSWTRRS